MRSEKDQQELSQLIINLRRNIHQHPELSGKEEQTAAYVACFLRSIGVDVITYEKHHGVSGCIYGYASGPVIALRADMDALPILEENDVEYKSRIPQVMHACGHDAHTAILLGVAKILVETRDKWAGCIKLIFQPAEEASPIGGAGLMIKDGILDTPPVDAIFGLHVWPDLACGEIGICQGPMMAASDRFTLTVLGRGSHACYPQKGVDAISIAADIIQGTQQIVARQIDPTETVTISIGTINGGERYNVVARQVTLEGTVRTLNTQLRAEVPVLLRSMAEKMAAAFGGKINLSYNYGYPVLYNSPDAVDIVVDAAKAVLGAGNVKTAVKPTLGAEDFAGFLEHVPGAYFWLGCRNLSRPYYPLHNTRFDIDEAALRVGANVLYQTALTALAYYMQKKGKTAGKRG